MPKNKFCGKDIIKHKMPLTLNRETWETGLNFFPNPSMQRKIETGTKINHSCFDLDRFQIGLSNKTLQEQRNLNFPP